MRERATSGVRWNGMWRESSSKSCDLPMAAFLQQKRSGFIRGSQKPADFNINHLAKICLHLQTERQTKS